MAITVTVYLLIWILDLMVKYLKRVESCKYLGVTFDYNLRWDRHIEHVINKTKYLIFLFYKLSRIMAIKVLKMINFAFFQSIVIYGIIAWGGAYKTEAIVLQNMQKRILSIVNKNTFPNKIPLNIKQLFDYESLLYNFKTLRNRYIKSESKTRNKSIQLPKSGKKLVKKTAISMP